MEFGLPVVTANGDQHPSKGRLLDVMLSAIDRKKKNKALLKEKASALEASLGTPSYAL